MLKILNSDNAFVVYYHKDHIYSFNAIIGALETDSYFDNYPIHFISKREDLIHNLKDIVDHYENIVVSISFFTTELWEIMDLMKVLKKKYKKKVVFLAGGPHPTGDPLGTLKLGFDIVVVGEGEETIIELLKMINERKHLSKVKGIAYLDEYNNYIYTGKRDFVDLDAYPAFPLKNIRFGAIEITRGCPYVCYFCQIPYLAGTIPRHRSIKSICKYVKELKIYYKDQTDVRFITPNAFTYGSEDGKRINLEKLESLLKSVREIIGKEGSIFFGTFPSEVRPENISHETLNLVLKYADNDNITIGAQSGSQKILDKCHRDHTVEDVYNAVNLILEKNLKVNIDFIFGLPEENEEDIRLTLKMMKDLSKLGARIHGHSFIPLPETPFKYKTVKRLNENLKREIINLISKGSLFGDWKKQERLALKISKYFKDKK